MKKKGIWCTRGIFFIYKSLVSPIIGRLVSCRYEPTCSDYTLQAVEKYGVWKGLWLGIKRFFSCHPFSTRDRYDPIP